MSKSQAVKQPMTMKKRLFYSNLLMVILPLLTVLLFLAMFVSFAKNFVLTDLTHLDELAVSQREIHNLVRSAPLREMTGRQEDIDRFLQDCEDLGYDVSVYQGERELFGNLEKDDKKYFRKYLADGLNLPPGESLWLQRGINNILVEKMAAGDSVLTVVAAHDDDWFLGNINLFSVAEILAAACLMVVAAIGAVVLISLFLAKIIVKNITDPLDALCAGAERVSRGDFGQDIPTDGTEEIGKVCRSFNEMQHRLLADMEKNRQYEKAKNEMLAGISHDLRTPLTSIKSYVKGILDGVARTPEKQTRYLQVAYRKSVEMEGLIGQLFLFSKLETGSFPFQFRESLITPFVEQWLARFDWDMASIRPVVSFNSSCQRETVLLDVEQMGRVLDNIVSNSLKYNKDRELHIGVSLSRIGNRVKLILQDDGIGVSDDQLERLFDSFYRGDESRSNPTEGSGLGLSIAKRIVTAHHGTIEAQNKGGLAIIITLPVEGEKIA